MLAINFGSNDVVVDAGGITYNGENNFARRGNPLIYLQHTLQLESILATEPNKALYSTGIMANPNVLCQETIDICINYDIPTQSLTPGMYEMGLRIIQAPWNQTGYRVKNN